MTSGDYGLLTCFCGGLNTQYGLSTMLRYEFYNPNTGGKDQLCRGWFKSKVEVQTLLIVSALSVVAINYFLAWFLRLLAQFERYDSKAKQKRSLTLKLFLSQLVNTAFLVLAINANLDYFYGSGNDIDPQEQRLFSPLLKAFKGDFDDFSEGWYRTVGTAIITTMLINLAIPHVSVLVAFCWQANNKCADRNCSYNKAITNKTTQKVRGYSTHLVH